MWFCIFFCFTTHHVQEDFSPRARAFCTKLVIIFIRNSYTYQLVQSISYKETLRNLNYDSIVNLINGRSLHIFYEPASRSARSDQPAAVFTVTFVALRQCSSGNGNEFV